MTEFTMDRLRENLESLDNYLERAIAENLNIVDVLNRILRKKQNPSGKSILPVDCQTV